MSFGFLVYSIQIINQHIAVHLFMSHKVAFLNVSTFPNISNNNKRLSSVGCRGFGRLSVISNWDTHTKAEGDEPNVLDWLVVMMQMVAGLAISLGLFKQSSSLKTEQCNQLQLCICGRSQTAGLDKAGIDVCIRWRVTKKRIFYNIKNFGVYCKFCK